MSYVSRVWAAARGHAQLLTAYIALVVAGVVGFMPQAATYASGLTIDIDMDPLFAQINTWVPTFFEILAIAGGILIAFVIARFVINAIVGAFSGKSI